MTTRILVRGEHDPIGRHQAALACVMEYYKGMPRDVVIVAPSQDRIRNGPFGTILGKEPTEALLEEPQPFAGHMMRHATVKDAAPETWGDSIAFVTEANAELLELVDAAPDLVLVVAVPSRPKEVEAWIEQWEPVQIGPPEQAGQA